MTPPWGKDMDWFFIMLGAVFLTALILGWTHV